MTANIILLDDLLTRYGPEAQTVRVLLRSTIPSFADRIWHQGSSTSARIAPFEATPDAVMFLDKVHELSPQNDVQRGLLARALRVVNDLTETRLLEFTQAGSSIPALFLGVLVFWLAIIFVSFGLFAQPNAVIIAALFISALSASGAIFLILELTHPFEGLMMLSSTPMRDALVPLDP
jgi:hypothetical protein